MFFRLAKEIVKHVFRNVIIFGAHFQKKINRKAVVLLCKQFGIAVVSNNSLLLEYGEKSDSKFQWLYKYLVLEKLPYLFVVMHLYEYQFPDFQVFFLLKTLILSPLSPYGSTFQGFLSIFHCLLLEGNPCC